MYIVVTAQRTTTWRETGQEYDQDVTADSEWHLDFCGCELLPAAKDKLPWLKKRKYVVIYIDRLMGQPLTRATPSRGNGTGSKAGLCVRVECSMDIGTSAAAGSSHERIAAFVFLNNHNNETNNSGVVASKVVHSPGGTHNI